MILPKLRLLAFYGSLLLAFPASATFHIMLDPGHGGVDTGAVRGSAKESDLVLKVAQKLRVLLEKDPRFTISMTRTQDHALTLAERVKLAQKADADLFVSLHANAADDPRARGVEFFFQNSLPADEESLFLANQENEIAATNASDSEASSDEPSKKGDVNAIVEDLQRQSRILSSLRLTQALSSVWQKRSPETQVAIKQAPFYVISKATMPSVLIEIGFLTNPKEVKKLMENQYQTELAQKIYRALVAYKEKMDNPEAKTLN